MRVLDSLQNTCHSQAQSKCAQLCDVLSGILCFLSPPEKDLLSFLAAVFTGHSGQCSSRGPAIPCEDCGESACESVGGKAWCGPTRELAGC